MTDRPHTRILDPGSVPEEKLTYVVIAAREQGKWIFVRHRERKSWEMPAGHIEPGESPDQAALRELNEETGTLSSRIIHVADYQVSRAKIIGYGRLYLAEVREREKELKHETAEVMLSKDLPAKLTYPDVQKSLFTLVEKH